MNVKKHLILALLSILPFKASAESLMILAPAWKLAGLSSSYTVYKKPASEQCLQQAVDRISNETKGGKASPTLVKNVFKTAKAYGLDPMIFLAMIYQESGDFKPHDSANGTGVAQMTAIAIRDACLNLETTSCKPAFANPEYTETWDNKSIAAMKSLFGPTAGENLYPWRKYCSGGTKVNRCKQSCGITADCIQRIDAVMMKDSRFNLHLAGHTLMNYMGLANKQAPKASMKERYKLALKGYNGHPKHKHVYASKVFTKLAKLKTFCSFE